MTDRERDWEDHLKWFEEKLIVRNKEARMVPLHLNNVQVALERYKWECMKDGKPCYILVLKARQEGVSTWAQATFFKDSQDFTQRRHIVVAHTEDASRNLFSMARMFVDQFPDELETKRASAKAMKFEKTQSEYAVQTAGSGASAGRSFTFNGAHFSEVDFWPEPEEFYGAMMQAVPDVAGTVVVIESTADGPMLFMNQLWDQAVDGRSEYKPFFFPWFVHHEYVRPVSWDDLLKYADRTWLASNRRWVEATRRNEEERNALGGGGTSDSGGSRGGDAGRGGEAEGSGGGADPEEQGTEREAEAGGEVQEPGASPGGHLPSDPGGRGGDRGDGGHDRDQGSGPLSSLRRWRETERTVRSFRDRGNDSESPVGVKASDSIQGRVFSLEDIFRDSLTQYESGLIAEFGLSLEHINWLRWCLENRCKGDETRRRREYPSRPEEAFEASGSDVLDPLVLATWARDAKENPAIAKGAMVAREVRPGQMIVSFDAEDRGGHIEIYEWPDPHKHYVLGLDPSQGNADGDWQVGFVMDIESGDQVAEYRAKIDPDIAVNQVEWLAIYYNRAHVIVEVNGGYGWPFVRHLEDRNTVPMYERMALDKKTRQYSRKPGWDTTMKTRPMIISEMKEAVRKERAKVRSEQTISEMRTLHENDYGKVEARPGYHDDGAMAYGITLVYRNQLLGEETEKAEQTRKNNSVVQRLDRKMRRQRAEEKFGKGFRAGDLVKSRSVRPVTIRPDGRRSYI